MRRVNPVGFRRCGRDCRDGLGGLRLSAPAQLPEPDPLPPTIVPKPMPESTPISPHRRSRRAASAVHAQPGMLPPGTLPPGSLQPSFPIHPLPMVRIQVRVPADSPPGDDIKYTITVTNVSSADAHSVTVRNPLNPEVFEGPVKADPECDKTKSTAKELVWSFGTLAPGKSKTIELTLRPKPTATEVKNLAYVRFEHEAGCHHQDQQAGGEGHEDCPEAVRARRTLHRANHRREHREGSRRGCASGREPAAVRRVRADHQGSEANRQSRCRPWPRRAAMGVGNREAHAW